MNAVELAQLGRQLTRIGEVAASAGEPLDPTSGDRALAALLQGDDPASIAATVARLGGLAARIAETPRTGDGASFATAYDGERPPWDIGQPQPAFAALASAGALVAPVLDVGCGTGEHTLMAAGIGLEAVGLDAVPAAIATAEAKARDRGLMDGATFVNANALALGGLGRRFRTILDSGFFHVLDDDSRVAYLRSLSEVTEPGTRYFLLCFSDRMPGVWGPRRMTQAEIRSSFEIDWEIDAIEEAIFVTNLVPDVPAWLASMTRR